jgi:hypothetical protein
MMKARTILVALVVIGLLGAPGVSSAQGRPAQGQDELWEVTTKMEMAGMPMAMPPQTQQVCQPRRTGQDEDMVPKQQDCRMTDIRRSGNRTTFTMVCEGKDRITGTGDIESDAAAYRGTIRMRGTMDGRPLDMTQNFSGRKIGACTYEDPRKRHDAMMAQQCGPALDQLNTYMFTTEQSPCKAQKPEFCARVGRLAQEMRDPQVYRATVQRRSDWTAMMQACGQDTPAITATACQRSIGARDFAFTTDYCEADARALAAQYCTGRDYTAIMSSEYAPLCRRYASDLRQQQAPQRTSTPPAPPAPPAAQQPSGVTDAAKEGLSEGVKEGLREGATEGIRRLFRW